MSAPRKSRQPPDSPTLKAFPLLARPPTRPSRHGECSQACESGPEGKDGDGMLSPQKSDGKSCPPSDASVNPQSYNQLAAPRTDGRYTELTSGATARSVKRSGDLQGNVVGGDRCPGGRTDKGDMAAKHGSKAHGKPSGPSQERPPGSPPDRPHSVEGEGSPRELHAGIELLMYKNEMTALQKGTKWCEICSKRFTRMYVLKRHMTTCHRSTTVWTCDYSGCFRRLRGFSRIDNARAHLRETHGESDSSKRMLRCFHCLMKWTHQGRSCQCGDTKTLGRPALEC